MGSSTSLDSAPDESSHFRHLKRKLPCGPGAPLVPSRPRAGLTVHIRGTEAATAAGKSRHDPLRPTRMVGAPSPPRAPSHTHSTLHARQLRAAISSVETPLSHNATSHQRNPAAFERRTVILRCDRDLAYPNRIPSHKLQPSRNLDLDPPAMAPAKASRTAHDESKSETLNLKEKNGAAGTHQSNGKMRRVASSAGSNLRESP
ncbi:hypothetical protein B0T25DRAFT_213742 [Lasiosphaeria hispida]|uniref:Uncharacterized protein n=1 Tax=Lasiosphaeria hispida TaxID=260671 RepID=A0AAJ0MET2_9PEZI|nr:hypothetical protein B0T25DRAFT_213742 [Lasiosphaeria hispida]